MNTHYVCSYCNGMLPSAAFYVHLERHREEQEKALELDPFSGSEWEDL